MRILPNLKKLLLLSQTAWDQTAVAARAEQQAASDTSSSEIRLGTFRGKPIKVTAKMSFLGFLCCQTLIFVKVEGSQRHVG